MNVWVISRKIRQYHLCFPVEFGYVNDTAYGRIYKNGTWLLPYPLPKHITTREYIDITENGSLFLTRGTDPTVAKWFVVSVNCNLVIVKEQDVYIYQQEKCRRNLKILIPMLESLLDRKLKLVLTKIIKSYTAALKAHFGECDVQLSLPPPDEENLDGFVEFDLEQFQPTASKSIDLFALKQAIDYLVESTPFVCKINTTRVCSIGKNGQEVDLHGKYIGKMLVNGIGKPGSIIERRLEEARNYTLSGGITISERGLVVPCADDFHRCSDDQLLFIPLNILYAADIKSGHQNCIIIDFKQKTIERYDPDGSIGAFGVNEDDRLEAFFKSKYPDFTYISAIESCPIFGPQHIEKIIRPYEGGMCVAYALLIFHERILNPEMSGLEIMERIASKRDLPDYIRKYGAFMESLMPTKEQYIAWIKLHNQKEFNVTDCATRRTYTLKNRTLDIKEEEADSLETRIEIRPNEVVVSDALSNILGARRFISILDDHTVIMLVKNDLIVATDLQNEQAFDPKGVPMLAKFVEYTMKKPILKVETIRGNIYRTLFAMFKVPLPTPAQIKELESGDYRHYITG